MEDEMADTAVREHKGDYRIDGSFHRISARGQAIGVGAQVAALTKDAGGYKTTPAMAAGVANNVWSHRDIAALLD
jgi:hypothetical protein